MERSPEITASAGPEQHLIIELWVARRQPIVGKAILREILKEISKRLGADHVASPAAVARILADEGAELRHPEIIEFDAEWREARIAAEMMKFKGLDGLLAGKSLSLEQSEGHIKRLEELRQVAESREAQRELRDIAILARQRAESRAKDLASKATERNVQAETVEWFKVWIQTPNLFADWLELRKRSVEFRERFSIEED